MKKLVVLAILIIGGCASKKNNVQKEAKNTEYLSVNPQVDAKVTVYSGVKPQDDTFFSYASSVLKLDDDLLLISDSRNNLIRQIKNNQISNFAGNGQGENIPGKYQMASMSEPNCLAIDSKKNIYVAVNMNQIAKIDPQGNVSMFAGKYYRGLIDGKADGEVDSPKETAFFPLISALRIDENDNIYVGGGHMIRKITTDGLVTTIAGKNKSGDKIGDAKEELFQQISDIVLNKKGEILVVDQVNKKIKWNFFKSANWQVLVAVQLHTAT